MKKKIAFVGNSAKTMHNFRFGVMKSLVEGGYDVTVVAVPDFDTERYTSAGIHFIPIAIDCHGTKPLKDLSTLWQFLKIYRQQRFDLIFHFTIKAVIYGSLAARILGIKYIDVITGLGAVFINQTYVTRLVETMYKHVLRSARECWFLNNDDLQLFLDKHIITKDKIRLLPGEGVNTTHFAPIATEEKTFNFLYCGRLLAEKGVFEYAEAARIIRKKYPEVIVNLLGGFDESSPITPQIVQKWIAEEVICYLGETVDVIPYLTNATCLVLPSYREGVSRSLMEAAAMEKPIITTDTAGCRDVVQDGVNGFLCTIKDVDSLCDCMEKMIHLAPEERKAMGAKGRQFVIEHYDEHIIIDIYHKTLQHYL